MLKILNAFAAALLSLIHQGMGHLYLGYKKRAWILIGICFFNYCFQLFGYALGFSLFPRNFIGIYWGISLYLILFILWTLFDSVRLSLKSLPPPSLKYLPSHKATRFLLLLFAGAILSSVTTLLLPSKSIYHYTIPSAGMSPTLEKGDQIVAVEMTGTDLADLRNAVVTYNYPPDESDPESYKIHTGRIAAIEGDKVKIDPATGNFIVNGKDFPLKNRGKLSYEDLKQASRLLSSDDFFVKNLWENKEMEIPLGHVFILQDNYSNGVDSRIKGPLDASRIGEKISFIYFSRDESGLRWDRINKLVE